MLTVGMSAWADGLDPIANRFLAAMPLMERGTTQIAISAASTDFSAIVSRAITPRVLVRGSASTRGALNLCARLLAPVELAPAFLAIELDPRSVTGLMTLFFGPVVIDLGRTWFEPAHWALGQWVVNPHLTIVIGGIQRSGAFEPHAGWRLFPTGSAQWEVGMMFERNEITLSFGGIL